MTTKQKCELWKEFESTPITITELARHHGVSSGRLTEWLREGAAFYEGIRFASRSRDAEKGWPFGWNALPPAEQLTRLQNFQNLCMI